MSSLTRDSAAIWLRYCVITPLVVTLSMALPNVSLPQGLKLTDGRINVRDDTFKPVFLDEFKFYPGTEIEIEIVSNLDVMRFMYETRECWSKWFGGIWCEYIKRSNGSGIGESRAPLILDLFDQRHDSGRPMSDPVRTAPARIPANTSKFDPSAHIQERLRKFSIALDLGAIQDSFTRGYVLKGRVAVSFEEGGNYKAIVRASCVPHRNREHCSQGQYIVKIKSIDTKERERMLARYLARKRTYAELNSPDAIDHFMRHEVKGGIISPRARLENVSKLLVEHARTHHRLGEGGTTNEDLRQILELAKSLDPENPDARNDLVRYHIDTGHLAQAKGAAGDSLKKYSDDYASGKSDSTTLRGLAQALRNGGQIFLKDRAATDARDVEVAHGFYERALKIWEEYRIKEYSIESGERLEIAQLYVDQARILSLIRTTPALERAEKALIAARALLPRSGRGFVAGVAGDHSYFVAALTPQPLAEVGKLKVIAGLLPPGNWEVVQARPHVSELVLRRGRGGETHFAVWPINKKSNPSDRSLRVEATLMDVQAFGSGILGRDPGTGALLAVRKGTKEILAVVPSKSWRAATDAAVLIFAEHDGKGPFHVWMDSKTTKLSIGSDAFQDLALSSNGKHAAILEQQGSKTSIKMVDLDKALKNDGSSITTHDLSKLPNKIDRLFFSQSGNFVVIQAGTALVALPIRTDSKPKVVNLPEWIKKGIRLEPLSGNFLSGMTVEGDQIEEIALINVAAAHDSGREVTKDEEKIPDLSATRVRLESPLPARGFVLAGAWESDEATLEQLTILAPSLPTLLQVRSLVANQSFERRGHWRPGDIILLAGGTFGALRDRSKNKFNLVDLDAGSELLEMSAGVAATGEPVDEVIPIPNVKKPSFHRVTRDESGRAKRIETYAEPGKLTAAHDFPTISGHSWVLMRQTSSPLMADQGRLLFVSVPTGAPSPSEDLSRKEYDEAFANLPSVATDIIQIAPDGKRTSAKIGLKDVRGVIAGVGNVFFYRRETGIAWAGSDGKLTYLDECGPATRQGDCAWGEISFSTDGTAVLFSQETAEGALLLKKWVVNALGQLEEAWRCKPCGSSNAGDIHALYKKFNGWWPLHSFAVTKSASGEEILLGPVRGGLGIGKPNDATWNPSIPVGAPIALIGNLAFVQRDPSLFEFWQPQ